MAFFFFQIIAHFGVPKYITVRKYCVVSRQCHTTEPIHAPNLYWRYCRRQFILSSYRLKLRVQMSFYFPIYFLPLSGVFCLIAAFLYTAYLATGSSASDGPAETVAQYAPVIYVAVASMFLHYIFLFYQSATAFVEFSKAKSSYRNGHSVQEAKPDLGKIKYGSDNYKVHVANRTVVNYSEQIIPFLVSLFLYATFVNVKRASKYGWMWLFFRSYYPWAFQKPFPALFLSTLPAYTCVWTMLGMTLLYISRTT